MEAQSMAEVHFQAASEAFDAEDYERAAAELEYAYELNPEPIYLYPWAQAERLRGNCVKAIQLYDRFLATDPPDEEKEIVAHNRELCEPAILPPPAPEPPTTVEPPADQHRRRPGSSPFRDLSGGIMAGLGVAAAVTGGTLLGTARAKQNRYTDEESHAEADALKRSAEREHTAGAIMVGAGGGLLLGAIIRYSIVAAQHRSSRTAMNTSVTRQGVGLWISGRF